MLTFHDVKKMIDANGRIFLPVGALAVITAHVEADQSRNNKDLIHVSGVSQTGTFQHHPLHGTLFFALDSHCPLCDGIRVRFYNGGFFCDHKCELATPVILFIKDSESS